MFTNFIYYQPLNLSIMGTYQLPIDYNDFINGLAKKTLSFEVVEKRAFSALFFDGFVIWLTRILLLLIILPVIIIPVLCFKLNDWWLLLGFLGIFFGNIINNVNNKSSNRVKNLIELALAFSFSLAVLIYYVGVLNPGVFSFGILVYSFFFLNLSDIVYDEIAKNRLIRTEKLFYYAVENKIIEVKSI